MSVIVRTLVLWVLAAVTGIAHAQTISWQPRVIDHPASQIGVPPFYQPMGVDPQGRVYMISRTEHFVRFDGQEWTRLEFDKPLVGMGLGKVDPEGRLVLAHSQGLALAEPNGKTSYRVRHLVSKELFPDAPLEGMGLQRVLETETAYYSLSPKHVVRLEKATLKVTFISNPPGVTPMHVHVADRYAYALDASGVLYIEDGTGFAVHPLSASIASIPAQAWQATRFISDRETDSIDLYTDTGVHRLTRSGVVAMSESLELAPPRPCRAYYARVDGGGYVVGCGTRITTIDADNRTVSAAEMPAMVLGVQAHPDGSVWITTSDAVHALVDPVAVRMASDVGNSLTGILDLDVFMKSAWVYTETGAVRVDLDTTGLPTSIHPIAMGDGNQAVRVLRGVRGSYTEGRLRALLDAGGGIFATTSGVYCTGPKQSRAVRLGPEYVNCEESDSAPQSKTSTEFTKEVHVFRGETQTADGTTIRAIGPEVAYEVEVSQHGMRIAKATPVSTVVLSRGFYEVEPGVAIVVQAGASPQKLTFPNGDDGEPQFEAIEVPQPLPGEPPLDPSGYKIAELYDGVRVFNGTHAFRYEEGKLVRDSFVNPASPTATEWYLSQLSCARIVAAPPELYFQLNEENEWRNYSRGASLLGVQAASHECTDKLMLASGAGLAVIHMERVHTAPLVLNIVSAAVAGSQSAVAEDHTLAAVSGSPLKVRSGGLITVNAALNTPTVTALYRFRSGSEDDAWSPWGKSATFSLAAGAPGLHRIEVEAKAASNERASRVIEVEVEPLWYQLWTVRAAIAVASFLLIGVAGVQYSAARNRKLKRDNDLLQATVAAKMHQLVELTSQLDHASMIDPATGLATRTAMTRALERELIRCATFDAPISAALVSVEHTSHLRESEGPLAVDAMFRGVASCLSQELQPLVDLAARHEEGEVIVLMPGTALDDAKLRLERIRLLLVKAMPQAKLCFGLAEVRPRTETGANALLRKAQDSLAADRRGAANAVDSTAVPERAEQDPQG